jgi:DNA-binding NarL/FixJ family response regulator
MTLRVLVVDDSELLRRSVRLMLRDDARLEVTGEAQNGREALDKAQELGPDVILMDLSMPLCDGLEAITLLRSGGFQGRIIVFSGYGDEKIVEQALSSGADGYVAKGEPAQLVRDTLAGATEPISGKDAGGGNDNEGEDGIHG